MNTARICAYAGRLLRHETAPYHEQAVRSEVEAICVELGLEHRRDSFGNVLVKLKIGPARRPLLLAAHLDHPGFHVVRPLPRGRWLARFEGGVPDHYFRPGLKTRLMPGDVPARITRWVDRKKRTFELAPRRPAASAPKFAVWDLEPFRVRQGRIYSRSCDDLVGAASVLATMAELKQSGARAHVMGLLSRAEEVGFHGALAAASSGVGGGSLPRNAFVISLETSRELPGVQIGQGVILRVGDRTSIFNPEATRFLREVAADLQALRKGFKYQRGLMSGGTCEATAFQELGFQTAAVCVGLGNYHNCGDRNQILAEYVNVADVVSMVSLLTEVARQMPRYKALVGRLPQRLHRMLREAKPRLRATA